MEQKGLAKVEMARRMRSSRAALDRLLDPANNGVTLSTLQNASAVVAAAQSWSWKTAGARRSDPIDPTDRSAGAPQAT
jgi:hypothetical protein